MDRAIADLAARQHGVVALAQLRDLGMDASSARNRIARGRLHRLHRGVYAVGHRVVSAEGERMAAVLACGRDAVLSHRSAAAHWGLRRSNRAVIDVTVPRRGSRPRPGIDIHRTRSLDPADVASVAGIPCTSIARTLLDLAEVVDAGSLRRACDQAEVLRIFDARALEDVLSRAHGRHGAPALRRLLDEHAVGQSLTRSELEERFLGLCAATGIARPEANAWIVLGGEAVQADFVWRPQRLVVETDGHRFHGTRQAFERDRLRDQRLSLAGWQVVRFTWLQLAGEPERVARTVRRLLARRSSAEVA